MDPKQIHDAFADLFNFAIFNSFYDCDCGIYLVPSSPWDPSYAPEQHEEDCFSREYALHQQILDFLSTQKGA